MVDDVGSWCERWLGGRVVERLWEAGHLSRVVAVRLEDGREAVVKVRREEDRLHGCVAVQRYFAEAGFVCPRPLTGIHTAGGGLVAHAEELVSGGEVLQVDAPGAVDACGGLFAEVVRVGRRLAEVPSLEPAPPWVGWGHRFPAGAGTTFGDTALWPPADDTDVDLNTMGAMGWLDEVARTVRAFLAGCRDAPVVGHADFEAHNVGWRDGRPWVVHDWDSTVLMAEAPLVGHAAAVWTAGGALGSGDPGLRAADGGTSGFPGVRDNAAFIEAYEHASGRAFSAEQRAWAWAAGVWTHVFNAKKWGEPVSRAAIGDRLRLAGLRVPG
jgi:hypothetical protein